MAEIGRAPWALSSWDRAPALLHPKPGTVFPNPQPLNQKDKRSPAKGKRDPMRLIDPALVRMEPISIPSGTTPQP